MAAGLASRDKRDIFYRLAKQRGYRARSAFKLLHLDEEFGLLAHASRAVDLCAAPGGWSQVLLERMPQRHDRVVVAVDLMPMQPIEGVEVVQGDITRQSTAERVVALFKGQRAHVVVCDGAPDVLGMSNIDEYLQHQLLLAALSLTTVLLEPRGSFVAKVFRGAAAPRLFGLLSRFFANVTLAKPRASRNSSIEGFVVCRDFAAPPGFCPNLGEPLLLPPRDVALHLTLPFVVCGSTLVEFDADRSYELDVQVGDGRVDEEGKAEARGAYRGLQPAAPPIAPPYEHALALKKQNRLSRGVAEAPPAPPRPEE